MALLAKTSSYTWFSLFAKALLLFPSLASALLVHSSSELPTRTSKELFASPPIDHAFRATIPHSYPHLFRHFDDIALDSWLRCCDPTDFWKSVCQDDLTTLPLDEDVLLEMDVHSVIVPHVRFLVEVLGGGTGRLTWADDESTLPPIFNKQDDDEECPTVLEEFHHTMRLHLKVPDWYYRISIDRIIAPWHAYLQHYCGSQHSGPALRDDKLAAFLEVCQSGSQVAFIDLCREWDDKIDGDVHTPDQLNRFLTAFRCGLLPACRNVPNQASIAPADMVDLLVTHGANFLQKDDRQISGLHWTAATHNTGGLEVLIAAWCRERYPDLELGTAAKQILREVVTGKDGATVLHWAACGLGRNWIGTGGSIEICQYLLELVDSNPALVDATTWNTGATPFMWAAWSGSIDVARLLVETGGSNPQYMNPQGQTAAHWAAAAGQLETCRYLVEELGLKLDQTDDRDKTPLDYAKLYCQDSILDWSKLYSKDRHGSRSPDGGSQ